jgi:hypothetical protein
MPRRNRTLRNCTVRPVAEPSSIDIGSFDVRLMTDQGSVPLTCGNLGSAISNTVCRQTHTRAGGFPMVNLMYACGGPEAKKRSLI